MDWLFGSSKKSEEEKLEHLDEEKQKHFNDCLENEHCKIRLADYLEGLKTKYDDEPNGNIDEKTKTDEG